MRRAAVRRVSCGVVVGDGQRFLIGHATRSPRWDIPRVADAGETDAAAAVRELAEETGLVVAEGALAPLGRHRYLPAKDLALFAYRPAILPDPVTLVCTATFRVGGSDVPEFDRFALVAWDELLDRVGKSMARVLGEIRDRLI